MAHHQYLIAVLISVVSDIFMRFFFLCLVGFVIGIPISLVIQNMRSSKSKKENQDNEIE